MCHCNPPGPCARLEKRSEKETQTPARSWGVAHSLACRLGASLPLRAPRARLRRMGIKVVAALYPQVVVPSTAQQEAAHPACGPKSRMLFPFLTPATTCRLRVHSAWYALPSPGGCANDERIHALPKHSTFRFHPAIHIRRIACR
ncbi:hypothetical protein K431DRAFT_139625 [Polychaeton citri CBS 116435]|uniref:Uncharacterized protein n=1 Tax=Polychaeton citri CBS 116435 TaxID=1314669 RepID=A0A9P4UL78_9PEZI|nr:hypothetical protein K431DRAFT_139625 [Polychaeton citri CBS 116435]